MHQTKVGKDKVQLLRQALSAANSSIKLANQLLNEVEQMGGSGSMPGLVGKYDGRFMITEAGKKYPVPDNYSAKTRLAYGDQLKMVEGPTGRQFKLLEKIPRTEQEAQLAVKDGQFMALGKDGSYTLLQSAVKYWGGEEGDKLKILLPEKGKNVPFACLVEVVGRKPGAGVQEQARPAVRKEEAPKPEEPVKEEPKEEVKEEKKPAAKKAPAKKAAPKKTAAEKAPAKKTAAKKAPAKKAPAEKAAPAKVAPKPAAETVGDEDLR